MLFLISRLSSFSKNFVYSISLAMNDVILKGYGFSEHQYLRMDPSGLLILRHASEYVIFS